MESGHEEVLTIGAVIPNCFVARLLILGILSGCIRNLALTPFKIGVIHVP